jgi:acyl-CoA hydrolase
LDDPAYYIGLGEKRQARTFALMRKRTAPVPKSRKKQSHTTPTAEKANVPGKPVSASRSELTEFVLPNDANVLGNMLGGRVMHLIDIAGALAAGRHANSYVVTASVDYLDFRFPIAVGEFIVLKASVNRVFNTSMEVGVKVFAENVLTGERRHTSSAYVTYVSLDLDHRPRSAPPLILETDEDRRRFKEAGERRQLRLATRHKEIVPKK